MPEGSVVLGPVVLGPDGPAAVMGDALPPGPDVAGPPVPVDRAAEPAVPADVPTSPAPAHSPTRSAAPAAGSGAKRRG
jgi:hypothetical protein